MPSKSCWQLSGWVCTVPAQHRSVALHDVTASRQMAPAGLHAWPLSQRPMVAPAALLQCTFVILLPLTSVEPGAPGAPQQSLSLLQVSPVGRHPLGGWQMRMPVAA
jgi:hypothetical protein